MILACGNNKLDVVVVVATEVAISVGILLLVVANDDLVVGKIANKKIGGDAGGKWKDRALATVHNNNKEK